MDPRVFDFVAEIVEEFQSDAELLEGVMSSESRVMTFGAAFFDQFFGRLGIHISGFSSVARRRAVEYVQKLPKDDKTAPVRLLIVAYEEFCALYNDAKGNYDGSAALNLAGFEMVQRILTGADEWVATLPEAERKELKPSLEAAKTSLEALE